MKLNNIFILRSTLLPFHLSTVLPWSRYAQIVSLVLLSYLQFNPCFGQGDIDRIEPPSWWVGMHDPHVQLMLHGRGIAELTPQIKYKGIRIEGVQRTDNPNFLFVDISIHKKTSPGTVQIDCYKGRTILASRAWTLEAREPDADTRQGFDNSDVIYLITPDRFANGDTNNDSVTGLKEKVNRSAKGGRHGGDIAGVLEHLDYIRFMGFTAVWLNPVLENDMERSSYHGYSTTDYYRVDPRFGTNSEFRHLVRESAELGLKHIMDMIPNHCGTGHWWMSDMPAKDWIHNFDTYTQTNHKKTVVMDPHVATHDLEIFTDGWFVPSMPDLNQRNPLVATYLTQNAIWWIEYLGLAGLRIDTYPYSDPDFMAHYCNSILDEYPNLNIVGEQWHTVPAVVAYWQKGVKNSNGYVSGLPCPMDFPLHHALITALNTQGGWDDAWLPVYETLAQDALYADPNNLMIFPDNHDMSRIFTQVNENYDLYKMALTFIMTTRGIPQIFYGTEILMKNPGTDDHTIIRSDFPGGWDGDTVNGFTGEGLTSQQIDAREFLRRLMTWRKFAKVIHEGKLMHYAPKDNVYVYFRYEDGTDDKVMVILNKNTTPYELSMDRFADMIGDEEKGTDVISRVPYSLKGSITVPSLGSLVLDFGEEEMEID